MSNLIFETLNAISYDGIREGRYITQMHGFELWANNNDVMFVKNIYDLKQASNVSRYFLNAIIFGLSSLFGLNPSKHLIRKGRSQSDYSICGIC